MSGCECKTDMNLISILYVLSIFYNKKEITFMIIICYFKNNCMFWSESASLSVYKFNIYVFSMKYDQDITMQ